MNLAEKHNIKWESRYDILTVEVRAKILSDLYEPFKERGKKEDLLNKQNHPRLIDENGNETNKLLIAGNIRDGHQIMEGFDEKGYYIIFQAKKNEISKVKALAVVEDKKIKLSELAKLQYDLVKPRITLKEFNKTQSKIDELFTDIFDIENHNTKINKYPRLFKDADTYFKFIEYTKKHIVEHYSDYSYLFQRLLNDELIYPTKHLEFMKWLHKEQFITLKYFELFTEKINFKSFKKSTSIHRENNFNNIFQ